MFISFRFQMLELWQACNPTPARRQAIRVFSSSDWPKRKEWNHKPKVVMWVAVEDECHTLNSDMPRVIRETRLGTLGCRTLGAVVDSGEAALEPEIEDRTELMTLLKSPKKLVGPNGACVDNAEAEG